MSHESDADFFAAAHHLLWIIGRADDPTEDMLLEALDKLAAAYYRVPKVDPPDDPGDPPSWDTAALRVLAGARFPSLGFYWNVRGAIAKNEDPQLLTGDAIDDIIEIAGEMQNNLWLLDHVGGMPRVGTCTCCAFTGPGISATSPST